MLATGLNFRAPIFTRAIPKLAEITKKTQEMLILFLAPYTYLAIYNLKTLFIVWTITISHFVFGKSNEYSKWWRIRMNKRIAFMKWRICVFTNVSMLPINMLISLYSFGTFKDRATVTINQFIPVSVHFDFSIMEQNLEC